ncbi:MAG TPA: hypothetical protein VFE65_02970 [Pseudonocardia sp.]|nr:hypothetical protein [Pseudonocardia sp.]
MSPHNTDLSRERRIGNVYDSSPGFRPVGDSYDGSSDYGSESSYALGGDDYDTQISPSVQTRGFQMPLPRTAPEAEPNLLSHPGYQAHPEYQAWADLGTTTQEPPTQRVPTQRGSSQPRHTMPPRNPRRRTTTGGAGWRRIGLAALAAVLVVLLGYGAVAAFRTESTRDETPPPAPQQVPAPPPDALVPAPAPPPAVAPVPAPRAPAHSATPPRRVTGTPPASLMARPGTRSSTQENITLPSGAKFTVFDSFPMSGSAVVTRALVVVHGTGRNAEAYFQRAVSAAKSAGASGHTIVIAPWFTGDKDKGASGDPNWENDAWKQGYPAESPAGLSSFTAMDNIMATLADKRRFPKLTHITLAGHSAGGQFTQRYAAFGRGPNLLPWVDFNFAVMNPSSYVYFDSARPGKSGGSFTTPSGSSCSDYNEYKYGLQGREGYPAALSAAAARAQFASRTVTILNGGADTVDNGDLDKGCGAMLQGANRNVRGQYFYQHFKALEPSAPIKRIVVPDVDHDGGAMLASPLSRATLFGTTGTTG